MKAIYRRSLKVAFGLAVLGFLGFAVAASGIVPIKASSGHWKITTWILQFGKERSIATHTIGMKPPKLDDPALVAKGAGHYHTGCRPCHGAPDTPRTGVVMAMTPHPPDLAEVVPKYEPEELFYIVRHGIKFTGMPAWPAQSREDEVWAMVAFLVEYPELDAAGYRRLAYGDVPPGYGGVVPLEGLEGTDTLPDEIIASCGRCHGVDGLGRGLGGFPILAGQTREYQVLALQAYAADARHSGVMQPIAKSLSTEQIAALSTYYAGLEGPLVGSEGARPVTRSEVIERGEAIALEGIPEKAVPACHHCHGPSPGVRSDAYPLLGGQYEDYLLLQLELFKWKKRGGSPYGELMQHVVAGLDPDDMRALAAYYASLGPGTALGAR